MEVSLVRNFVQLRDTLLFPEVVEVEHKIQDLCLRYVQTLSEPHVDCFLKTKNSTRKEFFWDSQVSVHISTLNNRVILLPVNPCF